MIKHAGAQPENDLTQKKQKRKYEHELHFVPADKLLQQALMKKTGCPSATSRELMGVGARSALWTLTRVTS